MKPASRARQRGLSLIELLVAMVIALVVTLAVTSMVIVGDSHKRATTSTNDMDQTGAYAAYALDRALRSAGAGFTQSWDKGVFGCRLNAAAILPRSSAFPAPFKNSFLSGATATLRVAPLLIAKNQSDAGSDVLVVMGGNGMAGGVPRAVTDAGSDTTLALDNTVGFSAGDLVLVSQSGTTDCLVEQVASMTTKVLTLGGTYYTASGVDTSLATLAASTSTYVTPLGNVENSNVRFQLLGVGDNRTLYGYDLLQGSGTLAQAIADGVVELHALYGLDTNLDGVADAWADPGASGYDIATMMATPATLRQVVAVRVALVLRSSGYEKELVSPATLTLFGDLSNAAGTTLAQTITLGDEDRHYRYRTVETTVPLRNTLLLPAS